METDEQERTDYQDACRLDQPRGGLARRRPRPPAAGELWLVCQLVKPATDAGSERADGCSPGCRVEPRQVYGIVAKAVNGKLLTERDLAYKAQGCAGLRGMLPRNLTSTFEDLARQSDIWSTSDQNDKRWQAAKMSTPSRLHRSPSSPCSASGVFTSQASRVAWAVGRPNRRRLSRLTSSPTRQWTASWLWRSRT